MSSYVYTIICNFEQYLEIYSWAKLNLPPNTMEPWNLIWDEWPKFDYATMYIRTFFRNKEDYILFSLRYSELYIR